MIESTREIVELQLNKGAAYFSVISVEGKVHLYFRRRRDYSNTMHAVSADGLNFSIRQPILSNSNACHNFSAYIGKNGSIEGIGGQFGSPEMPHGDGLYRFESKDGDAFIDTGRIVGPDHPGYINGMSWGMPAELDGHHCCVYDLRGERKLLFLRANPSQGERAIQVAQAHGIDGFGKFALTRIGNQRQHAYYTANFFIVGRIWFGLVPFVDERHCSLRLIASLDQKNWWICRRLFAGDPWINEEGKPKNRDHPVQGVIDRGDFIEFYVHHNYLGQIPGLMVHLARYKISKRQILYWATISAPKLILQQLSRWANSIQQSTKLKPAL